MQEFVATYDLKSTDPSPYALFKELGVPRRWFSVVYDSRTRNVVSLPNTTLSFTTDTMNSAVASFAGLIAEAHEKIPNFHHEKVTIVGGGEVCAFREGEPISY